MSTPAELVRGCPDMCIDEIASTAVRSLTRSTGTEPMRAHRRLAAFRKGGTKSPPRSPKGRPSPKGRSGRMNALLRCVLYAPGAGSGLRAYHTRKNVAGATSSRSPRSASERWLSVSVDGWGRRRRCRSRRFSLIRWQSHLLVRAIQHQGAVVDETQIVRYLSRLGACGSGCTQTEGDRILFPHQLEWCSGVKAMIVSPTQFRPSQRRDAAGVAQ